MQRRYDAIMQANQAREARMTSYTLTKGERAVIIRCYGPSDYTGELVAGSARWSGKTPRGAEAWAQRVLNW